MMLLDRIEDVFSVPVGEGFSLFVRVDAIERTDPSDPSSRRFQVMAARGSDGMILEIELTFATDVDATLINSLFITLQRDACGWNERERFRARELNGVLSWQRRLDVCAVIRGLRVDLRPGHHTTELCVSHESIALSDIDFYLAFMQTCKYFLRHIGKQCGLTYCGDMLGKCLCDVKRTRLESFRNSEVL